MRSPTQPLLWPHPIEWGESSRLEAEVLVLGGGIAGCWAAIGAAERGARVLLVEKGATVTSGAGGSGCDHWGSAATNPCSTVTPEELTRALVDRRGGYCNGISHYIGCREGWDRLLDLEAMGGKIRDTADEFAGAGFRDEATKLLFADDHENRSTLRVWGATLNRALYRCCDRLGVKVLDRTMATALLSEDGRQGSRVVGATGVHTRTGRFFVFHAAATVLCMSRPSGVWLSSRDIPGVSDFQPPQCSGDGHAVAWRAGAEFTMMETSVSAEGSGTGSFPPQSTENTHNTWYACSMEEEKRQSFGYPGGLLNDWELRTNLEGLFAAGDQLFASNGHGHAAATGHYAGRQAASFANEGCGPPVAENQVSGEYARIQALIGGFGGVPWTEVNVTIASIMQDHCGAVKGAGMLASGLVKLKGIWRNEALHLQPRNPYELVRILEVLNILSNAELVIHACLAREASAKFLLFERSDFPEWDPPEWQKFVTVRAEGEKVVQSELPLEYYGSLKEEYEAHNPDDRPGTAP
jgi:succinate dehydrogenase/fumarate reductase flavoprotein subunit